MRRTDLLAGALERRGRVDVPDLPVAHRVVDRARDRHRAVRTALVPLDRRTAGALPEQVARVAHQILNRSGARCDEGRQRFVDGHGPPLVAREKPHRPVHPKRPVDIEDVDRDLRRHRLVDLGERGGVEVPACGVSGELERVARRDLRQSGTQRRGDPSRNRPGERDVDAQVVEIVSRLVLDDDGFERRDPVMRQRVVHRGVEDHGHADVAFAGGED